MRGYVVVGLHHPKTPENVGGAWRAAHIYGAALLLISGQRCDLKKLRRTSADTTKAYRHIPLIETDNLFSHNPLDCVPVAVEITEGAIPLSEFQHPERAFYIFGPEDGSLGKDILEKCPHRVVIPTRFCMNLAATVNVVLYDRLAKRSE